MPSNKEGLTQEVKFIRSELLPVFCKLAYLLKRIAEVEQAIRKLPEDNHDN